MPFEDIVGYKEIEVVFRDGSKETVRVKQVGLEDCQLLMRLLSEQDDLALIAFYTGRDLDWASKLTPESQEYILDAAEELNSDFFQRWLRRRTKYRQLLMGTVADQDLVQKALGEAIERVMREATEQILRENSSGSPPQQEDQSKS